MINLNVEKFWYLMAKRGLTMTAMQKEYGLSGSTLGNCFRNKRCYPKTAGRIATALGVDVEEISVRKNDD